MDEGRTNVEKKNDLGLREWKGRGMGEGGGWNKRVKEVGEEGECEWGYRESASHYKVAGGRGGRASAGRPIPTSFTNIEPL